MQGLIEQRRGPLHLSHAGAVEWIRRISAQPLTGGLVSLVAAATLAGALRVGGLTVASSGDIVLLLMLVGALAASRWGSLRIGTSTRIYVSSVPLYMIACLYTPAVAGLAIGTGMLVRELSVCRECENSAGTVGSQVGRWIVLAVAISSLVHVWPAAYLGHVLALAALLMWVGDVLTCPVVIAPITRQRPRAIISMAARQSYIGELMQYLIAMLALLLFRTGILWTGIIWLDALGTLMVILPVVLLYLYLKGEDALKRDAYVPAVSAPMDE